MKMRSFEEIQTDIEHWSRQHARLGQIAVELIKDEIPGDIDVISDLQLLVAKIGQRLIALHQEAYRAVTKAA